MAKVFCLLTLVFCLLSFKTFRLQNYKKILEKRQTQMYFFNLLEKNDLHQFVFAIYLLSLQR